MQLYLDVFSGISGDMFLAACIDSGFSTDKLNNTLNLLIPGLRIKTIKEKQHGITGTKIEIISPENPPPIHHYTDFVNIIENSEINNNIKKTAIEILTELAKAESKIHGIELERVHFHEVADIDTLIDCVGASLIINEWNISEIFCSKLPFFSGYIMSAHGKIPLPAPATSELLKGFEFTNRFNYENIELITPTGAAILKTINARQTLDSNFKIEKIGYGFGTNKFEFSNFLRVFIGNTYNVKYDFITMLSFILDDVSPEKIGWIKNELENHQSIIDFYIKYIQMKKNRPGYEINIICKNLDEQLYEFLFKTTGTLGIRENKIKRRIIKREKKEINTKYGKVNIKISYLDNGKIVRQKIEMDDLIKIKKQSGKSIYEIEREIYKIINENT